jgi:hypothetical protein
MSQVEPVLGYMKKGVFIQITASGCLLMRNKAFEVIKGQPEGPLSA